MEKLTKDGSFLTSLGPQWTATAYVATVSILLTFILGRRLGPELFGQYSYVLTAAAIFAILLDNGYKTVLYRENTSPSPKLRHLQSKLTALAEGNALTFCFFGLLLVWLLPVTDKKVLSAAILCFSLQTGANFVSANLKAKGKFQTEAGWQILVRTLGAVGILFFLFSDQNEPFYIFTGWAAGITAALFLVIRHIKIPRFKELIDPELAKTCLALMAIEAATVIYFRIDIIILNHLGKNSAQVGEYAAAYRFIEGIVLIFTPVSIILFRRFRRLWQKPSQFNKTVFKAAGLMLFCAIIISLFGVTFKTELIQLAYGTEYVLASTLLGWLLLSLIFILPNGILAQATIAVNSETYYAQAAALCAAANFLLNIILIPKFGALGAAWATVITEAILLACLAAKLTGLKQNFCSS